MQKNGSITSPGRICLFGEHQDYLGLPVIPMAVNKRLKLHYLCHKEPFCVDISSKQIEQDIKIFYNQKPRLIGSIFDYEIAVFLYFWNQIHKVNLSKILIDSKIPIRAGLSSSAALLTALVFLVANIILKQKNSLEKIAEIAYICEHDIMGISCGRMDQYVCALGGIFHMTSQEKPRIITLNLSKEAFIIVGNSEVERKADIPLKTVQHDIFEALRILKNPDLKKLKLEDIKSGKLSKLYQKRLRGVIGIRDNTIEALEELQKKKIDLNHVGKLITSQQKYLRDNYQVSHPKIDRMCAISIKKGALGAKLTGAGFGGCMFAITDEKKIALRIKENLKSYGHSFITQIDSGVLKV
ncbi:MAG: galactokinase family protein [Candidatus Hodarchaeota archaeon]